jgi:hypothetical protein
MKTGSGGLAIIILSLSGSVALGQGAPPQAPPKPPPPAPPAAPPPAPPAAPSAAGLAPAGPPKPAPQLEQMKFFEGNWRCEGKGFPSPFSPNEHPIKATAKVKWDLNNFWQTFIYEEKKTKEHPAPAKVMGVWGWDAGGKRFVRTDADWFGGWFSPTSTGWAGDQFVWAGDLSTGQGMISARHTFTKKGDKEFAHTLEMTLGGRNTPVFDVACKK